jgi:molybdopterin converting factor small subunit
MVTIHISGHLKTHSHGQLEIALSGEFQDVGDVLAELWQRHPGLRDRVLDEQGEIREHVNVFAGGSNIKKLDRLATRFDTSEIHIFNAVSGG